MQETDQFIKVFEDCRVVSGASQSLIYDFTRKKYYPITIEQGKMLGDMDRRSVDELKQAYRANDEFNKFLNFLDEKELIFYCTRDELDFFPPILDQWFSPSAVSNLLLFRKNDSTDDFIDHLGTIESLGLKHVQLFIEDTIDFDRLKSWLISISQISIKSIEVFVSLDHASDVLNRAKELIKTQLVTLNVTDSEEFKILKRNKERLFNIMFIKNNFNEIFQANPPDPSYFNVDIRQYMEAQTFNTYFNEKLIIASNDDILVNINDAIIGNLKESNLKELVSSESFQKLSTINKDMIQICKDCEYRYMCVDSRTPTYSQGKWRYDQPCYYDPYTGEWTLENK